MPNDRLRIYLPIILALAIIAGIFIGYKLSSSPLKSTRSSNKYEADKISNILNFIKDYYVDTVNFKKLSENAINDILQNLDPHSYYIPASELAEANEPLAGNFDGIGVEFNIRRDTIVVVSTISGGPSEKVGIRPGDRIIKVENRNVAGIHITNNQVMKMLRGKRGTKVLLTVLHSTQNRFVNFTIIRDKIPTFSVDAAYMMEDKIGYIKIDKFSATTFDEYTKALAKLKKQGLRKLILDLRGNGGGYLDAAVMLSNDLLSKDKLIVYTQGRVRPKNEIYAPGNGNFTTQPLVVLIDEWSASASEIVAGAIQDNDRGTIIGRRSFGKGLVQEQVNLNDGSALRLTVARYYTPSGRCIQKSYKDGVEKYYSDFYKRFSDGELISKDSIQIPKNQKFRTSKGKIVYGGGGIMPDVFVPFDTSEYTDYYNKLHNQAIIYQFAFDYADKNRAAINHYKGFEDFNRNFNVTDKMFEDLVIYAEKNKIPRNTKQIKISSHQIKVQFKAYIARAIYGNEGFYPVIFQIDNTLKKALQTINKM